jgi:hypothetical protein
LRAVIRRPPPWTALVATALATAVLAGCGGDDPVEIDHSVVETAIETSVLRQQHIFTVVACPKGIRAERGRRFTCTATLKSGSQVPVQVTARDDTGNVHYEGFPGYVDGRPTG